MKWPNIKRLLRHPNLQVQRPLNYNPVSYFQHALFLCLFAASYCLLIDNAESSLSKWFGGYDSDFFITALFILALLFVWKARKLKKYIFWRLHPQMQLETTQYLLYTATTLVISLKILERMKINSSVTLIFSSVVLFSVLIYCVSSFLIQKGVEVIKASERPNLFSDAPHGESPIPSQQQSLAAISTLIEGAINMENNEAIAIALDGGWGDGKSSLIKMALKSSSSNYVVVSFEPWRYTSQESLVSGFYNEIGKAVESELPGFQMSRFDLARFAQGFISIVDTSGLSKVLLGSYRRREDHYPTKVNQHLLRHEKKLLVVIDDVDRLHDDSHVMRTLQLAQYLKVDIVRSVVIFVAEMDRIKDAIPQRLRKSYLQKFFDITVMVSKPTDDELVSFINKSLKTLELKTDVSLEADKGLLQLLRNFRGAKRVLSMLASDLEYIGSNVNAQDIFFMRVMYYVYPVVFSDIRDNFSMYFEYDHDYRNRDFGVYGLSEDIFMEDQIKHFEELFQGMGLSLIDKKRLKALLEDYFPHLKNVFKDTGVGKTHINTKKLFEGRRIGDPDHLKRYFIYSESFDRRHEAENALKTYITQVYIKSDDSERTNNLKQLFERSGKDNPKIFFTSLLSTAESENLHIEKDDRVSLYRDVLRLYFETTGYLVRDSDAILTRIISAIDRTINEADYVKVFEDIEKYMSHPSTGLRLLLYTNPTRDNFFSLRSNPHYDELRSRILKKVDEYYIDKKNDVFEEDISGEGEWRFILAQWSTSVCYDRATDLVPTRFKKVNDYILNTIGQDESKIHTFIMGAFWQNDLTANKHRFVYDVAPQAYEVSKYIKLVRMLLENEEAVLNEEQKSDFERFISQYEAYQITKRAANAPTVDKVKPELQWASNFHAIGAAFNAVIKIDNFGGQEDYLSSVRLSGKLDDGTLWEATHFMIQGQKVDEPFHVNANRIVNIHLYISDDFSIGKQMPSINTNKANLELIFSSNKKRKLEYLPEYIHH